MSWGRIYRPEDFHYLTKAEADEMVASGKTREQYDRSRLRIAYGDLCNALLHLDRARQFFSRDHSDVARRIDYIARALHRHVPDYVEFERRTMLKRFSFTLP